MTSTAYSRVVNSNTVYSHKGKKARLDAVKQSDGGLEPISLEKAREILGLALTSELDECTIPFDPLGFDDDLDSLSWGYYEQDVGECADSRY